MGSLLSFFLPGNLDCFKILHLGSHRDICIAYSVQLYFLFLLAGTILDVVFVGGVVVVVVVVEVCDGARGVVVLLFPLFVRNHAQDHLAHLKG